ncbi:MAG: hypothetical protein KDC46_10685 [Thermoleophilia bacterium]|nr:hypothetical protein [Thermoleophilia bacterium]
MSLVTHASRMMHRATACAIAGLAVLVAIPSVASAAVTWEVAPGYTRTKLAQSGCYYLGSSDQNGVFYTVCGSSIFRFDRTGKQLANIAIPAGVQFQPRDVAPSPDGSYLYLSQGTATPVRINRKADGTYALDTKWKLDQFSYWGTKWTPIGHAIATDGRGDIYLSNGSYWSSKNTQTSIAKYHPDGSFVTAFGDYGTQPGNWITNQDVAVSRDGRRVWVGENCGTSCTYGAPDYSASRITRYDFTPGGTYRFSRIVSAQGAMDGNPFPRCESAGAVHSAYSLSLDYDENLYATSTTCGRLQVYDTDEDPAKDRFIKTIAVATDATNGVISGFKNHYIGVDWAGRIYAAEWNMKFEPADVSVPALPLPALAPLPEPDVTAPTVRTVTVPPVSTTQDVDVTIDATDDMQVAELRLAREDGNWGPWQPFTSPVNYTLSDGLGTKGVYVQVRDMAGNASNIVYRTLDVVEPVGGDPDVPPPVADAADPVLVTVSIPSLTPTAAIQVGIEATDDTGVRQVRLANEDGNWKAWQDFADVVDWQLSAGQGLKAVYVQVRDGAGRTSNVILSRSKVAADAPPPPPPGGGPAEPDTTAPVLAAITIPAETTTQTVGVALDATDDVAVSQVRFANEDGNWAGWQAYKANMQWPLTAGYGFKLVYAQVRDAAGNESLVVDARTSYVQTKQGPVDAADPVLAAITVPDTTPTRDITVGIDASDDIAVAKVRFANEDGNWGPWVDYAAEVPHQLSAGTGLKVVYAQVRDAAGHESNVIYVRTKVVA